jgi:hypothetical protein
MVIRRPTLTGILLRKPNCHACQDIADSLDEGARIEAIIIYFSKAFDLIPYDRLLKDITKNRKLYIYQTNSEHFDVCSRSMANTYQRNKQDFIYRNGCAKEISKKIKDRKNKK